MSDQTEKHRVVIVGGGFGGLWAARSLRRADVDVTLVDKRNFHLFQPLLYQVATGGLSPADIASPLRGVLARQSNVTVKLGEMTGIDYERREIVLTDTRIPYDNAIIATGSQNFYFGNDSWRDSAPGLKTVEDALHIRSRIYAAFEKAEREEDPEERERLMTFVIVGGGATGVELAGALSEIARITLRDDFRTINTADARIVIVEGGNDILESFDVELRTAARKSLAKLGVEVRSGTMATRIDDRGVAVTENDQTSRIESRTVIWAAGVKASPLGEALVSAGDRDRAGRVVVDPFLRVPGCESVYVIGDLAAVEDEFGNQLPGTAPVAMSQARYVARRILQESRGNSDRPYRYKSRGQMAVIGKAAAVVDLGWARLSGYPAWLLWLFIHLMYLVEFDNRVLVFMEWAWNYFTRNRTARLITYNINRTDDQ